MGKELLYCFTIAKNGLSLLSAFKKKFLAFKNTSHSFSESLFSIILICNHLLFSVLATGKFWSDIITACDSSTSNLQLSTSVYRG